jgi:hypothetical protein
MNKLLRITTIFIYILFAQVYSVVHWHAQEDHDQIELRLSVHPPEVPLDEHDHEDHQNHSGEHEPNDHHFVGDWNYTIPSNTLSFKLAEQPFFISEFFNHKSQVLNRKPQEIPLKLPRHYLPIFLLNRAPPYSCL